jgi:penicillin-binding protein 2
VCGKTGTAEVQGKQDTSLFVAMVNPRVPEGSDLHQYVIVVLVEEGGNGSSVAAPIARRISEGLSYFVTLPTGAPVGSPVPAAVRLIPPSAPGD